MGALHARMIIEFPKDFNFIPRIYQQDVLRAFFIEKFRHLMLVQHRRSGKDRLCLIITIMAALMRPGLYLYLFPQAVQGRRALWRGRGGDGVAFVSMIPEIFVAKTNSVEMSITLTNGSIIQVAGASNPDTLVGSNPLGIVYSEFSLYPMGIRDYLSPILAENKGWEILNLTPRGRGPVYDLFMSSLKNPEWFVRHLSVDQTYRLDGTPVIPIEEINSFRKAGMDEAVIQQEYYVSFNSANRGAYYAQEIDQAEIEGRICEFEIKPRLKCFAYFDLGISDATSVWVMQPDGEVLKMVYYYENTGQGFEHYARKLKEIEQILNITIIQIIGPHDLRQRHFGVASPRSTLSIAAEAGLNFLIVSNISINDGIQSVKSILPKVWFHSKHCAKGIEAIRHYRREYDEELRTYKDKPLHDWSSHSADSFRYFAVHWMEAFARPEMGVVRKYHSSF